MYKIYPKRLSAFRKIGIYGITIAHQCSLIVQSPMTALLESIDQMFIYVYASAHFSVSY